MTLEHMSTAQRRPSVNLWTMATRMEGRSLRSPKSSGGVAWSGNIEENR